MRTGKRTGDGFRKVVLSMIAFIAMFGQPGEKHVFFNKNGDLWTRTFYDLQNSCANTYNVQVGP